MVTELMRAVERMFPFATEPLDRHLLDLGKPGSLGLPFILEPGCERLLDGELALQGKARLIEVVAFLARLFGFDRVYRRLRQRDSGVLHKEFEQRKRHRWFLPQAREPSLGLRFIRIVFVARFFSAGQTLLFEQLGRELGAGLPEQRERAGAGLVA